MGECVRVMDGVGECVRVMDGVGECVRVIEGERECVGVPERVVGGVENAVPNTTTYMSHRAAPRGGAIVTMRSSSSQVSIIMISMPCE